MRASAAFVAGIAVVACATQRVGRTDLPDGNFKLECGRPLADCLTDLTKDICREYGYEILQGKEVVSRIGVEPVNSVNVTSEAIVRCRSSNALVSDKPAPAAARATPGAPSSRCFPGSTQACLGPGACKGAQTCQDDGARFAPCDCGGAAVAPAPLSAGDAGTAPTLPPPDGGAP